MTDTTFFAQTLASNLVIGFGIYLFLIVIAGLVEDYKKDIILFFKYIYHLLTGV